MHVVDVKTAIRPVNSLMAAIAVYIGACIAANALVFSFPVLLAVIAAFLVASGGQAINDYFDFELDHSHKPKYRHLTLEKKHHLAVLAVALFVAGNIASFFINPLTLQISLLITVLLIVYSAVLTKAKFVGNIVVALGTALPLVFGAAVFGRFDIVAWLFLAAFFANWVREIVKDCQDQKKDAGHKKTLPMILPEFYLQVLAGILLGFAVVSVYVPVFLGTYGNTLFLVLVTLANVVLYSGLWEFFNKEFAKSQQTFKKAMLIALAGFLLGIL